MDKGTRIQIVKGKHKGVNGTVFWEGPNKWGEGTRLGVEGDDGQTYWVASSNVEPLTKAQDAGPPPPPELSKGDRVAWKNRGDAGTGTIFWVGQTKSGRPRVGINDDEAEDAVWVDARAVTKLEDEPGPPPGASPSRHQPTRSSAPEPEPFFEDDDEAPPPEPWSGPIGEPPVMDEPPPYDYAPFDDDDE